VFGVMLAVLVLDEAVLVAMIAGGIGTLAGVSLTSMDKGEASDLTRNPSAPARRLLGCGLGCARPQSRLFDLAQLLRRGVDRAGFADAPANPGARLLENLGDDLLAVFQGSACDSGCSLRRSRERRPADDRDRASR
jgi:hypothetical protein